MMKMAGVKFQQIRSY